MWYQVRLESGEEVTCQIAGKFRLNDIKLTNPVAVGDQVVVEDDKGNEYRQIKKILGRKNYVARQSPSNKHHIRLIACNVDSALLVTTIRSPKLKIGFIDRFLLMTEPFNIPTCIIFNKSDIYTEEDLELYAYLEEVYTKIGYQTLLVSALNNEGVEKIQTLLKDKTTLISGQSGVGKSTLVNRIHPGLELRTDELSDYTGKGQHTTTFAEMYELDKTSFIIDTPGIKTLGFNNLEIMDVAHNFKEIFKMSEHCKFNNCTHRNEPKCAVKEAVEEGEISELRYGSYLQIVDDIEQQNYWERHKM